MPWPQEIPLQVFGSRIRFSIRLNDLRKEALNPDIDLTVDQVMAFFNPIIGELLNRYTKEIEDTSERKKTWKYVSDIIAPESFRHRVWTALPDFFCGCLTKFFEKMPKIAIF